MERKLATIVSADVAGYSRLMSADEEGTLRRLKSCRDLVDVVVAEHRGRVFGGAGDSVIAEFASPVEAVRCAIEIQDELAKRNAELPQEQGMWLRVGINLGDVIVEDDSLFGEGVNVAARLEGMAEPGGICLSGSVYHHVRNKLGRDCIDLGEQSLKNIPDPVRVHRIHPVRLSTSVAPAAPAGREAGAAVREQDWTAAFALLSEADRTGALSAGELELLAESAWWTGRIDDCINAEERAYALHCERGDRRGAAAVAMRLAEHHFHRLARSVAASWFARAEHLLEGDGDSVEYGYLVRSKGRMAYEGEADVDRALDLAQRAAELGARFGDRDLELLALHDQGCALVAKMRVDEGMAVMEKVMAAALGGELGARTTGRIFCNMIDICDKLADYRRAGEWHDAAKRWCVRTGHSSGFPGICRVRRAGVMHARGQWAEAEEEARCASVELGDFLDFAALAFYQIGEIRLEMGDFAAATEAFRRAHELGRDPQPGLARLKLSEGNLAAATAFIRRALDNDVLTPLDRAKLLPTQVEIALAAGDHEVASAATEELESIAAACHSPAIVAAAAYAKGSLRLAGGQGSEAVAMLERSSRLWHESGLPYDEARARVMLGLGYRAQGAEDLAHLEFAVARTMLSRLGASLELRRLTELAGPADDA